MRLRKPCEHDRYDAHAIYERGALDCPGGEFLPEDALVIEKVAGEWPEWALTILGEPPDIVHPSWTIRCLDSLRRGSLAADQVGEPE